MTTDIKQIKNQDLLNPEEARGLLSSLYNQIPRVSNLSDMHYRGSGKFSIDGEELYVIGAGLKQICQKMGISNQSFLQCDDSLKESLVETLLIPQTMDVTVMINQPDNKITNILKADHAYLSMLTVFDKVMEHLKEYDPLIQLDASSRLGAVVNFITKEETAVPKVNHVIRAGLMTRSKIVDMVPELYMGPYSYTLHCSNGMVGENERIQMLEGKSRDQMLNVIRGSIAKWYDNTKHNLIPHLVGLTDVEVKDPAQVIHRISKEISMGRAKELVMDRLPTLGDNPSMYDLVNLVTNVANEFDLDTRLKLQTVGGRLVETVEHRCPHCKTILN